MILYTCLIHLLLAWTISAEDCRDFEEKQCRIMDNNLLQIRYGINSRSSCQVLCREYHNCNWFTWYEFSRECMFYSSCDQHMTCEPISAYCVLGPTHPNIEDCYSTTTAKPTTTPKPTTTTTTPTTTTSTTTTTTTTTPTTTTSTTTSTTTTTTTPTTTTSTTTTTTTTPTTTTSTTTTTPTTTTSTTTTPTTTTAAPTTTSHASPNITALTSMILIGGETSIDGETGLTQSIELVTSDYICSAKIEAPAKLKGAFASYLPLTDKVLYCGGENLDLTHSRDCWTLDRAGTWKQVASLLNARTFATSWVAPDGTLFVIGGTNEQIYPSGFQTVEMYDSLNDKWSPYANIALDEGRWGHCSLLYQDKLLFVIGGYKDYYSIEKIDITSGDTTVLSYNNNGLLLHDCVLSEVSGEVGILTGGGTRVGSSEKVYFYSIGSDTWTEQDDLQEARLGSVLASLEESLMMMGGVAKDQTYLDSIEENIRGTWIQSEMFLEVGRAFTTSVYIPDDFVKC